ncbi:serine O-acetyltransferase [Anthocerotibacter panamensis]|uniref:serine O-acetyltransferase n=1 Tax=Anthocerotibacter panamensis TaxID=2857077 RepID=UPI001C4039DD|nr:serine O-acetyltransferase [Anthocerotibacter panamensis]
MLGSLKGDIRAVFEKDPAAKNFFEVILCYPGLHAVLAYRVAHWLLHLKIPVLPRVLSFGARFLTGIEIHPAACIGRSFFIDHGMGVVIGETAIIGDHVLMYQGVTLGGTGKQLGKRHPTLGNNVVVGAGAKVLGNIEVGNNVRIGAGSVVLHSVPGDCTVVGVPGRVVYQGGKRMDPLAHAQIPDPVADVIRDLIHRVDELEQKLDEHSTPKVSAAYRSMEEFHNGLGI